MGYCKKILLFLFLASTLTTTLLAQIPSCGSASQFYSKDSINVTTFGASTVQGIMGYLFQPYLQQDFLYCFPGKTISITNFGIAGQTTTQGLARFDQAIAGRTGFVCILMGINDMLQLAALTPSPTAAQITKQLKLTQNNMQAMLEKCIKANLIPILGTVQFVNDAGNPVYKAANSYVTRMNTLYKQLAKQDNITIADINAAMGRNFQLFQADGIHPNAAGDKLIAYVWFDALNAVIEKDLLLVGLNQNFPNPAISSTTIGFSLSQSGRINMQLYSITGALIKSVLANEIYNSGYHQITIEVNDLAPGIYIYVLQVAGRQLTKKMIVIR